MCRSSRRFSRPAVSIASGARVHRSTIRAGHAASRPAFQLADEDVDRPAPQDCHPVRVGKALLNTTGEWCSPRRESLETLGITGRDIRRRPGPTPTAGRVPARCGSNRSPSRPPRRRSRSLLEAIHARSASAARYAALSGRTLARNDAKGRRRHASGSRHRRASRGANRHACSPGVVEVVHRSCF